MKKSNNILLWTAVAGLLVFVVLVYQLLKDSPLDRERILLLSTMVIIEMGWWGSILVYYFFNDRFRPVEKNLLQKHCHFEVLHNVSQLHQTYDGTVGKIAQHLYVIRLQNNETVILNTYKELKLETNKKNLYYINSADEFVPAK